MTAGLVMKVVAASLTITLAVLIGVFLLRTRRRPTVFASTALHPAARMMAVTTSISVEAESVRIASGSPAPQSAQCLRGNRNRSPGRLA